MPKPILLFVCTGNSARSVMAEALMKQHAGDRYEVHSAGTQPKGVNPLTLRVLNEIGIPTEGFRSKSIQEYLGKSSPTHVFFVCDAAEQQCPRIWPFALHRESWSLEDPAAAVGSEEERLHVFREIRDQIDDKVQRWLAEHQSDITATMTH